jgi:hypothetical protein
MNDSLEVVVSAVVAEQMLKAAGVAATPAAGVVSGLVDDFCGSAPHRIGPHGIGPRTAYLLEAAVQLNAIATPFGHRTAIASELRKVAQTISARAFQGSSETRNEPAASATLLHDILRRLEKTGMNHRANRSEVAKGLIDQLQSKQLVTREEATNLQSLVKVIVTGHENDTLLASKIQKSAKRILDSQPGPIAGGIANALTRAALAVNEADFAVSGRGVQHG